jgi:hypothetical protein
MRCDNDTDRCRAIQNKHRDTEAREAPSTARSRRPMATGNAPPVAAPLISEERTATGSSSPAGSEQVAAGRPAPASSAAMSAWITAVAASRCRVAFRCSSHVRPMTWQSSRRSCLAFAGAVALLFPLSCTAGGQRKQSAAASQ